MDTYTDRTMTGLQDLAEKLHQERLFVRSEQEAIHQLNKQIRLRSEQLSHVFWTTRQHHLNLDHFITNSSQGVPAACSQRAAGLDNVKFVDAYKELGYQESIYANFLLAFRSNPTLAAACLAYGEKLGLESTTQVVQSVVLGIYGNSIISGDHKHLLELMETLLLLQLANEDQPRRILNKGNAAFCIVYKLFTESLLAGRLFLISALHKPVMQVLMEDELYLERDSKKIVSDCFSQIDIEKKFGNRDDPEFENRVKKHLQWTEDRFFEICQSFIDSLHAAMFCFPQSMGWIIARAYHIVEEAGIVSHSDARALCADLMLQMFISPAIVNPELYGVTGDAPISELTRFNLMQIAQTLQVLALSDENVPTENSFYGRFEKNCMSSLLDAVISTWLTDGVPSATTSVHGFKDCSVFLTCTQLAQLVQLLKDIQHADVRGVDQSSLTEVLNHLPDNPPLALVQALPRRKSASSAGMLLQVQREHLTPDIDGANMSEHRDSTGSAGHPSPLVSRANGDVEYHSPSGTSSKKLFSKSLKYSAVDDSKFQVSTDTPEVVLVISLTGVSGASSDPPGMLSENEVLEIQACEDHNAELISESDMATPDPSNLNDADSERMNKRPAFSHYSTVSDMSELGEARLEAMSSASGSSMDRTESVPADDTSSFRGNSSHGNQDEDLEMEDGDLESVPHTNNDEALKALERKLPTSRESIEDKMRKFEIRSQLGVRFGGAVIAGLPSDDDDREETGHVSSTVNCMDTRSETWSTDAYASDSEAPNEQSDQPEQSDRLQEISVNRGHGQMRRNNSGPYLSLLPRDEDSRSDVWSVEVLPGDSEPPDVKPEDRLQELESESNAGQEDPIDQLEYNRSRASTPGLSAASGVSGTSGFSLVSDNIHAKVGEERESSSEKSYGKTPSSISPDADDMLNGHGGRSTGPHSSRRSGAGSSNSSASGECAAATNARPQSAYSSMASRNILLDAHSLHVGGNQEDGLSKKTNGVNNMMKGGKTVSPGNLGIVCSDKNSSPSSDTNDMNWFEKPAKAERTVEVNGHFHKLASNTSSPLVGVPDGASALENNTIPVYSVVMESDNANTIKRSPYKVKDLFTSDKASAFNSVPSSLARDLTAETFGVDSSVSILSAPGNNSGNFIPHHSSVKTNGFLPGHLPSSLAAPPTSTFVPITSAGMYSQSPPSLHDLSAFVPLVSLSSALPEPARMQPKLITTGNNLLNMNSMSAALVGLSSEDDNSHISAVDQQSEVASPVPARRMGGKQAKYGRLKKHISLDQDSRGIDRKKSWWKSPRLPGLSTKRKTFKRSSSLQIPKEESVAGNGEIPNGYTISHIADDAANLPRPLEPKSTSPQSGIDTLGEDIMEKYIRKAASDQSSPRMPRNRDAPLPSSAPLDSMPVSSNTHESSKSSFDDTIPADKTLGSQNANVSSNTDSQSTPGNISSTANDRTVTTEPQGTPPNLNPPAPVKTAKAEQSDCLAVKVEYKPDPAQLIADAQRKLRLVLATSGSYPEPSRFSELLPTIGMQQLLYLPSSSQNDKNALQNSRKSSRDEILLFLKLRLAEAVSLQDHSRIAQIHETTRCIQVLDGRGCKELLQNLWRGYKQRSAYIAYLARTKQVLLKVSAYLQHMFRCTERDQETCRRYLTTVCVNLFLKRTDQALLSFRKQFMNATAADEKVTLVRSFLSYLYGQISMDGIWENASEEQLQEAERTIERSVFVFIYKLAISPNGDGDVLRDQLFFEHIARLGDVVTTQHPALLIPKKYLNECPWLSAQAEAKSVNAYKTPRDKLAAVLRCCNTIMNLLKMADEGTVPGADDFTPVLVFVLIKANPPRLLSTVQYITSFIGDELTGEDSYWWMQFTAATEFIKTIDERK